MSEAVLSLVNTIQHHAKLYYEGEPEITDEVFDQMVEELRSLDPENVILHTPGWGYKPEGKRVKVRHLKPLYSIDTKIKDFEVAKSMIDEEDLIQPKYDGASVTLYYRDSKLVHAITRGDGIEGYDVKNNINLKGYENAFVGDGELRCEVCMSWEDWKSNYDIEQNPSPRNLITGILGKLNPEPWEVEIAHVIVLDTNIEIGSTFNPRGLKFAEVLDTIENKLPSIDYPVDGYVIKNLDGLFAFKPMSEFAETTIKDIVWQKGNTGKMTPVLQIEPVKLSGATISRVTGNSFRMMEVLGTGVGAKVRVFRSGEVIPCILDVIEPSTDFRVPEGCTHKGAHIFQDINININEKLIEMMPRLVKGLGWSLIDKFKEVVGISENFMEFRIKLLNSSRSFTAHEFKLLYEGLIAIENIEFKVDFINLLNLPNIGYSACMKIVKGEKLPVHSQESWDRYSYDVNNLIAEVEYFNQIEMDDFPETQVSKGNVVITGKHEMKRSEMEALITELGYTNQGSVNKDTDFLIITDVNSTSSKAKKARELGVKLIGSVGELNG